MKTLPTFLLIAAACLLLHGIVVEAGVYGRPLVYGHEMRDGQRVRFLAQRFDLDQGLSIKLPDHGWVWMTMEEPGVIYVLAKDAMIESDPACGNVVRLRLLKK